MTSAIELGSQKLINASALSGGKLTDEMMGKYISGVDSALLRLGTQFGVDALNAGLEELTAGMLTPVAEAMILEENIDMDWSEMFYDAFLGMMAGGVTGAPSSFKR